MNKKLILAAPLVAMALLSSCLTSLHNLVAYKDAVSDNRIIGDWQYDDLTMKIESVPASSFFKNMTSAKVNGEEKKSIYDSKEDSLLYSGSYIIDFTKNNYRYYMVCCLTRIGKDFYADIEPLVAELANKPTGNSSNDLFNEGSYITTHSIAKVIFRGSEMEFRILNGDFIKEQLSNGTAAIKYERDELFSTTVITSSSDELRQFLSRYGNDERLYSPKNTVILKKIGK